MKNIIYVVVFLAILVVGFFFFNNYIYNEKQGEVITSEENSDLAQYFADQMFEKGTEDGLIPIEGFDAGLLMGKFSGLVASDFSGVASFEGIYSVENGEVVYTRTSSGPVSSAETTVSRQGYATLLENISARLSFPVRTESDVDLLIEQIR